MNFNFQRHLAKQHGNDICNQYSNAVQGTKCKIFTCPIRATTYMLNVLFFK